MKDGDDDSLVDNILAASLEAYRISNPPMTDSNCLLFRNLGKDVCQSIVFCQVRN